MSHKPDIVFLVLDTQRADRLGCYGHNPISPNIDQFASQSALFTQAISPAQWTIPSHASMFTGLYPTAHQVTQSYQSLGDDVVHLAEVLQADGYETVGFCNNPLVGVLDNGFRRGFDQFYNYGGAIPTLPQTTTWPRPLNTIRQKASQFLRYIAYPIQNFFGQSDLAFRLSLNTWVTPLWSRIGNFKGQNERSVGDINHYLRERNKQDNDKPLFLFINLMETHLPFVPPSEFIEQMAPDLLNTKEARTIMRTWNSEAYRWGAPLSEPLSQLENRVLNSLYDAEVAYQDAYLADFFATLTERKRSEDTLTLIVGDHGDGLGEHGCMGHAFVAYQELVHVPLIVNWPARIPAGTHITTPVSTRRVYHTLLDAVGKLPTDQLPSYYNLNPADIHRTTLLETINGNDPENMAVAEVYPPLNMVSAVKRRNPQVAADFRIEETRRALVQDEFKLIHVDEEMDELFHLAVDPLELDDVLTSRPGQAAHLNNQLNQTIMQVKNQRDNLTAGIDLDLEADEELLQRLRGLGYID